MEEVTIARENINSLITDLMADYDVIGPVKKENRFNFDQISSPSQLAIDYDTSLLPPSKWIFQNNEPLLEFDLKDIAKTKEVVNSRKQVLAFVHPCDINGINMMDEVLGEDPVDAN